MRLCLRPLAWLAASLAFAAAPAALAQDADPETRPKAELPEGSSEASPPESPEPEAEPEPTDFRPTESVPPGSSVSFPVDI